VLLLYAELSPLPTARGIAPNCCRTGTCCTASKQNKKAQPKRVAQHKSIHTAAALVRRSFLECVVCQPERKHLTTLLGAASIRCTISAVRHISDRAHTACLRFAYCHTRHPAHHNLSRHSMAWADDLLQKPTSPASGPNWLPLLPCNTHHLHGHDLTIHRPAVVQRGRNQYPPIHHASTVL